MKDFFDLLRLAQTHSFSGDLLVAAVHDTFARRNTVIPATRPTAFTSGFAKHPSKVLQWNAFRRKSGLQPVEEDFVAVIEMINQFLGPVVDASRDQSPFPMTWLAGGPWMANPDK